MSLAAAIVGFGFVLKDQNLLRLALLSHFARDLRALNERLSDRHLGVVHDSENRGEDHRVAFGAVELLHINCIAFGHLVLLAARFNDCVHLITPPMRLLAGCGMAFRHLENLAERLGKAP